MGLVWLSQNDLVTKSSAMDDNSAHGNKRGSDNYGYSASNSTSIYVAVFTYFPSYEYEEQPHRL